MNITDRQQALLIKVRRQTEKDLGIPYVTKKYLVSETAAHNKSLQLTNNTPLRSALWLTEFKRQAS